jgi:hypothetical protein
MKKLALICAVVLVASISAQGKVAASRPSMAGLRAKADKHESAGQYAQAAKSARAALAFASIGRRNISQVPQIRKQLRRLARRLSSVRRLKALTAVLAKRPVDLATRERIIKLCVMELDNPTLAATFINEDIDPVLQTYVPLAAGKIDQIAEAPCRELAKWYSSCLEKTSRFGRIAMLRRVASYYDRFLKLHTAADAEQQQATLECERVVRQLADLGETFEKAPS